ncbi:MAG TPA: hypothetical protein VFN30_08790 [Chitinophagaceae bacterium]|nr:hypothetical protein [Chitinophagaceae bacterium]
MKKLMFFVSVIAMLFLLSYCSSSKRASAKRPLLTYDANLALVINENCVPCHIPAKGGNKKPFNTYEAVRIDIDEMIRRISLNPGDKGYMPFKRPKLADSVINIFKQWKEDGLRER